MTLFHNLAVLFALFAPAVIKGSLVEVPPQHASSIEGRGSEIYDSISEHAPSGCLLTCNILKSVCSTCLVTPHSDASLYDEQADAYWSATAWAAPTCIFTPKTIHDLRAGILASQKAQCKFAVRSGGHSPFRGFAGIDKGLLISMSGFKDLQYDKTSKIQRSGMGNRWGDVYSSLTSFNRTVVGGRLNDVGLALASGGGLSHLSNMYGWACQNVISYEVMLANGSHVEASALKNPSLYYGARVGNNNFGVITHLNQQTYPLGKVWGGTVVYSGEHARSFMAALADFQAGGQLDAKAAVLPYLVTTNDTILVTFAYLGETDHPSAFDHFYGIPNVSDNTQIYDNLYELSATELPNLPRWAWAATTTLFDKETYVGIIDIISSFNSRTSKLQSGTLALMPQPISTSMVVSSRNSQGGDPLNARQKPQLWMGINVGWSRASDDENASKILQDCLSAVERYTRARGFYDPLVFANDAFPAQHPLRSYGEESFAKLKAASRNYDPSGVFQGLVPGGFKLT